MLEETTFEGRHVFDSEASFLEAVDNFCDRTSMVRLIRREVQTDKTLEGLRILCHRNGKPRAKADDNSREQGTPKKSRKSLKCGCKFLLQVRRRTDGKYFVLQYNPDHTGGCNPSPEQKLAGEKAGGRNYRAMVSPSHWRAFAVLAQCDAPNAQWDVLIRNCSLRLTLPSNDEIRRFKNAVKKWTLAEIAAGRAVEDGDEAKPGEGGRGEWGEGKKGGGGKKRRNGVGVKDVVGVHVDGGNTVGKPVENAGAASFAFAGASGLGGIGAGGGGSSCVGAGGGGVPGEAGGGATPSPHHRYAAAMSTMLELAGVASESERGLQALRIGGGVLKQWILHQSGASGGGSSPPSLLDLVQFAAVCSSFGIPSSSSSSSATTATPPPSFSSSSSSSPGCSSSSSNFPSARQQGREGGGGAINSNNNCQVWGVGRGGATGKEHVPTTDSGMGRGACLSSLKRRKVGALDGEAEKMRLARLVAGGGGRAKPPMR